MWVEILVMTVAMTAAVAETGKQSLNLLLFGGNGFIGGESARQLLEDGHTLTLASRGREWPWDLPKTVAPHVRHVKCDRRKPKEGCADFWSFLKESNPHFDAVIDFSAYYPQYVEPFYDALKGRTDVYIYISSDSVYEVSEVDTSEGRLLMEEEAVRPSDPRLRDHLAQKDSYGHGKLQVEELLRERRNKNKENGPDKDEGIPFVFLRLPDVLGERDSTDRIWKYIMWLEFSDVIGVPVAIPSFARNLRTSYVYVKDVASVIRRIMDLKIAGKEEVYEDKTYNVGYSDPMTLEELLTQLIQIIYEESTTGFKTMEFIDKKTLSGEYFLPSVTLTGIETSKVREELGFIPTPLADALLNMVVFYEDALAHFPRERDEIAESLMKDLGITEKDKHRNKFLNELLSSN